jgi:hypothetical protein
MAHAITRLYPGTEITIGPVVENGFYYDVKRPEGFTPDDLVLIENEMRKIARENHPVVREEVSARGRDPALPGHGPEVQGRDHRRLPGRRDHLALPAGRLRRPLPRSARAVDR